MQQKPAPRIIEARKLVISLALYTVGRHAYMPPPYNPTGLKICGAMWASLPTVTGTMQHTRHYAFFAYRAGISFAFSRAR